jgi:hypothetical protein
MKGEYFRSEPSLVDVPYKTRSFEVPLALWWWIALLIVGKVLLTANEEILAFYLPHDDLWQIRAAARGYWGGKYAPDFLYHLPIYPLFIKLVSLTGIPLRLATELVFCGACAFLAASLYRTGVTTAPVSGIVAVVTIFHPASFQLPNRCGAEILLSPLLMAAIAASMNWWAVRNSARSWRWAVIAAVFWSLTWNVRKESIVLVPIIIALGLSVIIADRAKGVRVVTSRLILGMILPLIASAALSTAFKAVNYVRWGLFANSVLTAPGYTSAFKALQRIQPAHPIDFIPVPVEVRKRAYAASPAFAELQPFLEGPVGKGWAIHSRVWTDGKGMMNLEELEIAAGWFYWCLYDAVIASGHSASPDDADHFLSRIAEEIESAISEGRLSGRWVPTAFLDPEFNHWAPRLPKSFALVYRTLENPAVIMRQTEDLHVKETCGEEFDRWANRRSSLTSPAKGLIEGWVTATRGQVQTLLIRSNESIPLGITFPNIERPDVDASVKAGFKLQAPVTSLETWRSARFIAVLDGGCTVEWPISDLSNGRVHKAVTDSVGVQLGIDRINDPRLHVPRTWRIQSGWEEGYFCVVKWSRWLGIFGLAAMMLGIFRKRSFPALPVIVLMAVAILIRVAFFAVIDASAWNVDNQPRYLFAVMPLHVVAMVLLIWAFLHEALLLLLTKYSYLREIKSKLVFRIWADDIF